MHRIAEKVVLVDALSAMIDGGYRSMARQFLEGLSGDELQFIAAYFGARTMDTELRVGGSSRGHLARQIETYGRQSGSRRSRVLKSSGASGASSRGADAEHKMILLLEYLTTSGLSCPTPAWRVQAGSA